MKQKNLIEQLTSLLKSYPEIKAAWLTGSYGRGNFDEYSDIDFIVCIDNSNKLTDSFECLNHLITQRDDILFVKHMTITHTINAITKHWDRFDVTLISKDQLGSHSQKGNTLLFDHEGIFKSLSQDDIPDIDNKKSQLVYAANEFLRILGLLPVVLGRQDYVISLTGIQLMKDLLITLMTLDLPVSGKLSLKKNLLPDDYKILFDMPVIEPTRDAVIALNVYLVDQFLPRAKSLFKKYDLIWPDQFEKTTIEHIENEIKVRLI